MGAGFQEAEEQWRAGLGTLRQVVRQELVSRQLATHLPSAPPALRVLDVGCGQGTQLLALARCGHLVTGLDSSAGLLADLREALAAEAPEIQARVTTRHGDVSQLSDLFPTASFDAVLCHGVLMYFADPDPVLTGIARLLVPGGLLSVLVRNGDGLAMRPGLLSDWAAALEAFAGPSYRNRLGLPARADRLAELTSALGERGLRVLAWYGVRVFTDPAASDAPLPEPEVLAQVLACEELAGRTDPYRSVAALTHVVAQATARSETAERRAGLGGCCADLRETGTEKSGPIPGTEASRSSSTMATPARRGTSGSRPATGGRPTPRRSRGGTSGSA